MLKGKVLLLIAVSMIVVFFPAVPVIADSISLENKENFRVTTSTYDQSLLVGSVSGYSLIAGDNMSISWKGNQSGTLSPPRVYLLNDYQFHGWDYFRKLIFLDPASRGWLLRNDSWEMTLSYSITSSDTYYVIIDNPNWIPDILPPSIDIIFYHTVQNYPNSYYLTIKTDPHDIVSIPGQNWYLRGYDKILTAPLAVTVNSSFQYRFRFWDVDGVSYGVGVNTITVEMNSNHTATAHYVPFQLLEHDGSFSVRFSTRDPHWSTPHTLNGSIDGYSLTAGQLLFVSWSVVVQPLGSTPYIYLLDSYQIQGWYWNNIIGQGVASYGYLKLVESWQDTIEYQIVYPDTYYVIISNRNPPMGIVGKTPIDITSYDAYLALPASYYLSVRTDPEGITPIPGEGWYTEGSNPELSAPTTVPVSSNTRYRFEYWDVDGVSRGVGVDTIMVGMNANHTATAHYVLQCQVEFDQNGLDSSAASNVVTINSASKTLGDLPYVFWADAGRVIAFSYNETVLSSITGKQFVLTSVTGAISPITVSNPVTVIGNYKTQYYLTVISPYGSPVPTSGWFDAGTSIHASVVSPVSGPSGTRYACTGWIGTGSVPSSGSGTTISFSINEPSSITWNWKIQYLLMVQTNPSGLTPQPARNPMGEVGPTNSWWYDSSLTVTLTAQSIAGYTFNYWDVDSVPQGDEVNPITVSMNGPHTATAHYTQKQPLSVSISPLSADILLGQSVAFTSTVNGGTSPYSYQWYLDSKPVLGATTDRWTFTPTTTGIYYIYLKVTDSDNTTAQSETARVTVRSVPVGGYSVSIRAEPTTKTLIPYSVLMALLTVGFATIKRKAAKRKTK